MGLIHWVGILVCIISFELIKVHFSWDQIDGDEHRCVTIKSQLNFEFQFMVLFLTPSLRNGWLCRTRECWTWELTQSRASRPNGTMTRMNGRSKITPGITGPAVYLNFKWFHYLHVTSLLMYWNKLHLNDNKCLVYLKVSCIDLKCFQLCRL